MLGTSAYAARGERRSSRRISVGGVVSIFPFIFIDGGIFSDKNYFKSAIFYLIFDELIVIH